MVDDDNDISTTGVLAGLVFVPERDGWSGADVLKVDLGEIFLRRNGSCVDGGKSVFYSKTCSSWVETFCDVVVLSCTLGLFVFF